MGVSWIGAWGKMAFAAEKTARQTKGKAKAAVKDFLEKAGAKMKRLHYEASAAEALRSNFHLSEKPVTEEVMTALAEAEMTLLSESEAVGMKLLEVKESEEVVMTLLEEKESAEEEKKLQRQKLIVESKTKQQTQPLLQMRE